MADQALKRRIQTLLKAHFPEDTVDVSDGFADNIHVVVVSNKFDGMREKEKQDQLWSIIDSSDLTQAEKVKISMILPWSPRELK
jgi:acid stress-induced BolA-like protein IbaG/YrbA